MAPFQNFDTAAYLNATFIVFCSMEINLVKEKYRQIHLKMTFFVANTKFFSLCICNENI